MIPTFNVTVQCHCSMSHPPIRLMYQISAALVIYTDGMKLFRTDRPSSRNIYK